MREQITSWAFPVGRAFGITVRVHFTFPFIIAALILRQLFYHPELSPPYAWIDLSIILGLMFFCVLLHEFGHCFGARYVHGDAQEILIWPLGGLAFVDVPHTPRANFITVICGPLVNLVICLLCVLLLLVVDQPKGMFQPPWNPLPNADLWRDSGGHVWLTTWSGVRHEFLPYDGAVWIARLFWVNWFTFLLNVLVIAFPLDGARIVQCILWPHFGYRQATFYVVISGFVFVCLIGVYAVAQEQVLALAMALFIYQECRNQWILLESGGEDSLFGYDFSQGYTSLERDAPPTPKPAQPNWWERWRRRRAEQKAQRELETREADESRMDSLLEKISSQGMAALTDEERRFMKQFSDRYKNRR